MGREKRSPRRTNEATWAAAKGALISIYSMKDGSHPSKKRNCCGIVSCLHLLPTLPFFFFPFQTPGHLSKKLMYSQMISSYVLPS